MTPARFPHSDTPGSQLGCQLPRAYRRLQRPSSALDAKASTMCPLMLAKQTLNKQHKDTKHYNCTTRHPIRPPNRADQVRADARVHYQHDKHQETNQP